MSPPAREAWPVEELARVLAAYAEGSTPDRDDERAAVKGSLAELARQVPGRSVEVRVPPYSAVQVVGGSIHRRGTPSAVVEMNARTWLELATGEVSFAAAVEAGRVLASGERSDLSEHLPIQP